MGLWAIDEAYVYKYIYKQGSTFSYHKVVKSSRISDPPDQILTWNDKYCWLSHILCPFRVKWIFLWGPEHSDWLNSSSPHLVILGFPLLSMPLLSEVPFSTLPIKSSPKKMLFRVKMLYMKVIFPSTFAVFLS